MDPERQNVFATMFKSKKWTSLFLAQLLWSVNSLMFVAKCAITVEGDRNRDLGSPRCYCVDSCNSHVPEIGVPVKVGSRATKKLHQIVFLFPTNIENQSCGKLCQDLGRWRIAQVLISETSVNVSHMSIRTHSMRKLLPYDERDTMDIPAKDPAHRALRVRSDPCASLALRACSCANLAVHVASRDEM